MYARTKGEQRFNEAAGFTQRKPVHGLSPADVRGDASMRPPVLPSVNKNIEARA